MRRRALAGVVGALVLPSRSGGGADRGDGYVDAGTFLDSGPEGGSSYYPPDADDVAGHAVELDGPTDRFLVDELTAGDDIICTVVSGERGDVCATFTID